MQRERYGDWGNRVGISVRVAQQGKRKSAVASADMAKAISVASGMPRAGCFHRRRSGPAPASQRMDQIDAEERSAARTQICRTRHEAGMRPEAETDIQTLIMRIGGLG